MQVENWKKVKEILQLEAGERQTVLREPSISEEIRREVVSLLAQDEKARDFMTVSARDFFPVEKDSPNLAAGQRVGIYEIVREIGCGGMGAVYLGKRADGKFEQQAAIKMLKRELNVEILRLNFKREREILSKLNHPNIARLLDAGTTDDGVPFLVMEYIEGVAIDEYCERENLPLKARLKLFNRVCEAVAYAHRNLIIHRDLKPSNILVTGDGEPKLLDFGLSKLLDADRSEDENNVTMRGALTPNYASPEQIIGKTVSTATDVYSLGVILYKMLTGKLPYNFDGKTNGSLLKVITEEEPTAPSLSDPPALAGGSNFGKLVSSSKKNPPANAGGSDRSQLKGDLDNIILKSLRKEPERRYPTVEQFSADVWRYIDGLPVAARPTTFAYRAAKFYGRNKISVLAAVLVFLSLVAGIVAAGSQANAARQQADIAADAQRNAEAEAAVAKTETEKAEKISRFMFKVLAYANPAWYAEGFKSGGQARVIDAMEDLGGKIDTEFAGEPDVQAELHHKFAEVYNMVRQSEGDAARKEHFAERQKFHALAALELRRQFYGEWHELVAKDMYYADGILEKTKSEQAETLAKAIEMMRATNPNNLNLPYMLEMYAAHLILPDAQDAHEPYRAAARPPTDETNYALGERYEREAIRLFRIHYKEDNRAVVGNECVLAYALVMQNKWADFDEHYQICKQGKAELQRTKLSDRKTEPTVLELLEKVLAEK